MNATADSTPAGGWQGRTTRAARTAAAVAAHAPESAAYGLIAMAPLGAALAPSAMMLTLIGTVLANAVASLLGGGRIVSGPRASLALLTAGFVAALIHTMGPGVNPWVIVILISLSHVAAGLLQAAFGWLRFGGIVKFTPYPVRLGLSSGIGLLLLLSALPVTLGHGFGAPWSAVHLPMANGAVAVGAVSLATAWAIGRYVPRLPAALLGLSAGMALHATLHAAGVDEGLSPRLGVPVLPAGTLDSLLTAGAALDLQLLRSALPLLASHALAVALLCSLDTLLATSVVDGRLRTARNANRELVAQGASNVAAALVAGQAASPSVPRTLTLLQGERSMHRHVVLAYSALLAVLVVVGPELLGSLPASAVGGILVAQALPMIASPLWRTPIELWSRPHRIGLASNWDGDQRRLLASNWAVVGAVTVGAVLLGLGPAVLIGAGFAVILFVRANMRDVVRRIVNGSERRSLKMRPLMVSERLRRESRRTAVIELEGALFFGTADALRERLQALPFYVETAVLDMHQVQEIDITGARILFEIAEDWRRAGRQLVFSEWMAGDARRKTLEAAAGLAWVSTLRFVDTTDLAMEQVEDAMIERLGLAPGDERPLGLAETMLANGLSPQELESLAADLVPMHFAAGEVMFRQGDAGDALYVSVKGQVGLYIPGSQRRLASFAPGVSVGEMAVLAHGVRSADAVAESEVDALRLSVEAFDRIKQTDPALAAKVLNNIALHLGERVRVLTGDLAHWVARSATIKATGLGVMAEMGSPSEQDATG